MVGPLTEVPETVGVLGDDPDEFTLNGGRQFRAAVLDREDVRGVKDEAVGAKHRGCLVVEAEAVSAAKLGGGNHRVEIAFLLATAPVLPKGGVLGGSRWGGRKR